MTGDEKRHVDGCATFFKNTTCVPFLLPQMLHD